MIKGLLNPICALLLLTFSLGIQAQWDNPLVYYQFNETTGFLVADSSGNNFDSNTNCDDCWEAEGKFNGSLLFEGVHKMDLPADTRITSAEVGQLMLEAGVSDRLRDTFSSVFEVSCLEALMALKEAWQRGEWNPKRRPQPVQRIIQPIQMVIRDILISELNKAKA